MSLRPDTTDATDATGAVATTPARDRAAFARDRDRDRDDAATGDGRGRKRRLPGAVVAALLLPVAVASLVGLAGCDYLAEKKLVPGVHTEADVRNFMGKPEMIREEPDGSRRLEYPRSPMGSQTYFVYLDRNGKYVAMEKAMSEANFAKVRPGMGKDDVRGILGKQTDILPLKLKDVEVWSWRYEGDGNTTMLFNVTFDNGSGKVTAIGRERDPRTHGGA